MWRGCITWRGYLRDCAEDVRVVLLEAAHAREPCESARKLIAMQDTKVCQPHGQLAVRSLTVLEHEAVPGAVHRLQPKLLTLDLE